MKMNKILVALTLMFALLGAPFGALATGTHVLDIAPSGSQPVPDSISVTDTVTSAVVCQALNAASKKCFLPDGAYQIAVTKVGHTAQPIPLVRLSSDWESYYVLTPTTPTTPPPTNGETPPPTDNTGATASAGMVIKSLDFNDETKPNSDVEFTVELKNLWVGTDGKGVDAREVTAHLTIQGIDDGSDVTEDLEFGAIDYKDTEEQTVTLHIPLVAEDEDFTVSATVSWENKDGVALQSQTPLTKTLTVERADNDVAITGVEFDSASLTVGDNSQVAISLANIGKDDEDVRVRIQSDVLGVSVTSPAFKLRESKEITQYMPFDLGKDVKTGKYPMTITVSFGSESVSQSTVLSVSAKAAPQAAQSAVTVTPVTTTVQDEAPQAAAQKADANTMAGLAVLLLVIAIVAFYFTRDSKLPVVVEKKRGGK